MPDLTAERKSSFEVADALEKQVLAIPSAASTVYSGQTAVINLYALTVKGLRVADCEVRVFVPDMLTAELVDADTVKVSLVGDTVPPIDSSSVVLVADGIDMLGAGGVGDKGQYFRYRLPTAGYRYLGLKIVKTGTGVSAGVNATIELLF